MSKSFQELAADIEESFKAGAPKNISAIKNIKDGYAMEFEIDGKPVVVTVHEDLPFTKIFARIELALEREFK